jgi:hypothetical protein
MAWFFASVLSLLAGWKLCNSPCPAGKDLTSLRGCEHRLPGGMGNSPPWGQLEKPRRRMSCIYIYNQMFQVAKVWVWNIWNTWMGQNMSFCHSKPMKLHEIEGINIHRPAMTFGTEGTRVRVLESYQPPPGWWSYKLHIQLQLGYINCIYDYRYIHTYHEIIYIYIYIYPYIIIYML